MPIGDEVWLRKHIGNLDIVDVPDSDLTYAIEAGDAEVIAITPEKTDWSTDTGHPLFEKARFLSNYFASFYILDRYGGDMEKANTHYERFEKMAERFEKQYQNWVMINGDSGSGSGNTVNKFNVAKSPFRSYPKNPDVEPIKSVTNRNRGWI